MLASSGTTLVEAVELVWDMITANALLVFFLGTSIVSMGFGFFRKAKRAAR